jgi:transposase
VDNGPCHHGAALEAFEFSHWKTLRIIYFPKYSPQLNPVEQCWKPGKRELANRVIPSIPSLKYRLHKVFEDRQVMPKMFEYLSN